MVAGKPTPELKCDRARPYGPPHRAVACSGCGQPVCCTCGEGYVCEGDNLSAPDERLPDYEHRMATWVADPCDAVLCGGCGDAEWVFEEEDPFNQGDRPVWLKWRLCPGCAEFL